MSITRAASAPHQHSNADLIMGAAGIAATLGLPRRQVEHLLGSGYLKSPRRVGGRWFVGRAQLLREFGCIED